MSPTRWMVLVLLVSTACGVTEGTSVVDDSGSHSVSETGPLRSKAEFYYLEPDQMAERAQVIFRGTVLSTAGPFPLKDIVSDTPGDPMYEHGTYRTVTITVAKNYKPLETALGTTCKLKYVGEVEKDGVVGFAAPFDYAYQAGEEVITFAGHTNDYDDALGLTPGPDGKWLVQDGEAIARLSERRYPLTQFEDLLNEGVSTTSTSQATTQNTGGPLGCPTG